MSVELLELFQVLSRFDPPRRSLQGAPWERYVEWSIPNGLAPLAAYNLEYRMAGGDAPEWAREKLLSVYQGVINDNVMKLVSFKRAVSQLEGRRVLLFGGASYADSLYPHAAFRPISELRLLLRRMDLDPFAGFLTRSGFKDIPESGGIEGATRAITDDYAALLLYAKVFGERRGAEEEGILARALPARVYGPSILRPDIEDALLLTVFEQARSGFDLPFISFVDLRELLLGGASVGAAYTREPEPRALKERSAAMKLERALYASLSIVGRLYPEVRERAMAATPELSRTSRGLLDSLVVEPVSALGKLRIGRGVERLRTLLTGM